MNQNKFNTRWRYISGQKRFISFVAKEFKLQKLTNVKNRHLEKYVEFLKENDKSDKYIKNELSAIRFFHNHTSGTKYELMDSRNFNKEMNLGSTPDGRADRAWSEKEIIKMKDKAVEINRPEIAKIVEVVRATGLRLDEVCNIRWDHINNALKTDKLTLDGSITKGGVSRSISLTERAGKILEKSIEGVNRGEYVFTPKVFVENHTIHKFEKSIQNFIGYHRQGIQNKDRSSTGHNLSNNEKGALTVHGLRHSFAREQYLSLRDKGLNKSDARIEVSNMLGHGRDSVTYIYLGGLEE